MKLNICILFVLFAARVFAQGGVGEWTDHLSFSSAEQVIEVGDKIYCVTTGGLFAYDQSDNSIRKMNGINGLSDVNPCAIGYGEEADVVLIAYENSNLDFIYENEIFNLSDIKRKQIQGDKKIYNILVVGKTAYLSCGFGIVAVNLEKREIKDTYYIGEDGSHVLVLDMTFDGTYLYAATDEGIFMADINTADLQDFNSWVKVETIPHVYQRFDQLEFFNGSVIASYQGEGEENHELYKKNGEVWDRFLPGIVSLVGLQSCHDRLVISMEGQVQVFNTGGELIDQVSSYSFSDSHVYNLKVQNAFSDKDEALWMADANHGLVKKSGGNYELTIPQGPIDNRVFLMTANGEDLWVATGGRSDSWNNVYYQPQAQLYRNGNWNSFSNRNYPELNGFHDIVNIVIDPQDPDHMFAGCWGGGVVEFRGTQFINRYNQFNSSLQTALPDEADPNYVRIGGMAFDSKNNLWVTNSIVGEPLSVFSTDGTWESFELEGIARAYDVGNIVITENDDQWIVIPRGRDLFVRKADGSDERHLNLISYFNNGENELFTRMNDVYSIAIDHEGAVWVGTSKGVAVYFNPEEIWENSSFYATQPGLDLADGIYHPLLETEIVTAIAVDGANRKWIGTKNSGVFLISEDGQEEIENFNESNSPLLSNTIMTIAISEKTGEVFFGTPEGIISYRGEAIDGRDDYADVYAFPNPVREDYDGDIVVTGLVADTDVKITDISGNLVFQTTSLGGQAIWNGKNLNGNRVSTGVYMVFGNDKTGERTFTTKILFIH